jgi:hypothetical protein
MPAEPAPVNEKRPASRHLEFTAIETEWAGDAEEVRFPDGLARVKTTRDVPPDMLAVEAAELAAIAASGATSPAVKILPAPLAYCLPLRCDGLDALAGHPGSRSVYQVNVEIAVPDVRLCHEL